MRVKQNEEMRGSMKSDPSKSFKAQKANPPTFKSGGGLPAIEDSEE